MKKIYFLAAFVAISSIVLFLASCGTQANSASSGTGQSVQGVVASGAPIVGLVTLRDSSPVPVSEGIVSNADGSFSFNVDGLTPPFFLSAVWTDGTGTNELYSFADGSGITNINPISSAVFAAAAGLMSMSTLTCPPTPPVMRQVEDVYGLMLAVLRAKIAPLLDKYGAANDPVNGDYVADHTGLDALFDDVTITVYNGMIIVTNKQTGSIIFSAPVGDISSGTFNGGNMPGGGTAPVDGVALYATNCSVCHQALAASTVRGATASQIQAAIASVATMSALSNLSSLEIQAISSALSSSLSTTTPQLCPYTYTPWGDCQPNNTQSRILVSVPSITCNGGPILSQACVFSPVVY
ncbi:MAG TPA: hypothetical protein VL122_00900 [Nitrospirota bacterium]|nr:hypothetical protein [Nitrospirota bacterium]